MSHGQSNHKSVIDFPNDIDTYLEELKYNAILGPFQKHPVVSSYCSPFMNKTKQNSGRCCMIIDLSCPIETSVNTDIDKISYLGTVLFLTFSTGDNITNESKHLGYGALLYRVDAFHHRKVDL